MNAIWIAISEFIIAGGLILFWIYFFKVENQNPNKSSEYLAFERSFPIPDLVWLTPALIISGITLLQNSKVGIILTIGSGGSLLFLGLLDTSFNIQNEGYTKSLTDMVINLSINITCIGMGIVFLIVGGSWITF
ncbi:hypothetical protein [Candidatus Harpocratesius sp.]